MNTFKVNGYEVRPDLYYDPEEHYWIKVEENRARIGFEPLEQETRGALVVVNIEGMNIEGAGKTLKKGDRFGSIEAEKHVGILRTPISGTIAGVNPLIGKNPHLVNKDPYGEGWLIEIELSNFAEEKQALLTGEETLRSWYKSEIKRYEEKGWLAES